MIQLKATRHFYSLLTSSSWSLLLATTAILPPSLAIAVATAWPIPRPPPVIIHTLPESSLLVIWPKLVTVCSRRRTLDGLASRAHL